MNFFFNSRFLSFLIKFCRIYFVITLLLLFFWYPATAVGATLFRMFLGMQDFNVAQI